MKEIKKLYSLRLFRTQLEYLRKKASNNHTTVTQYITDLINIDMKNTNK